LAEDQELANRIKRGDNLKPAGDFALHTFGFEVKHFLKEAALFLVPNFNIIES